MKIFKFPLRPFEVVRYELPTHACPLSALTQGNTVVLYVQMNEDESYDRKSERHFAFSPTGDVSDIPMLSNRKTRDFLGTVTVPDKSLGTLVFHVFEVSPTFGGGVVCEARA